MQFIQANGLVFHVDYRPQGAKPTVVFINSLGTDLRIWDEVTTVLERDYAILRYDKRGHGLSDVGSSPYTMADHAADLVAICGVLGIKSAVLCGLSVGGMIAQSVWSSHPELIRGLILCDTAHVIGTAEFWATRIEAIKRDGLESIADGVMQRWFAPSYHQNKPVDLQGYRSMMVRTPVDGYVGTCAAIRDADLTESTKGITVPTLCMVGDKDGATPPDLVKSLAELIPNARFHVIEDAGHLPPVEHPQIVLTLIQQFLQENHYV